MCGRYTQTRSRAAVEARFKLPLSGLESLPRYNLAPGQNGLVLPTDRVLRLMRWGLIPAWAKNEKIIINARVETAAEKPSFRNLFKNRRCLVVADGFYEWLRESKSRLPYRFTLQDGRLFSLAGLWDRWRRPDGTELETYTILTTQANDLVAPIHHRMPVILDEDGERAWLNGEPGGDLLRPYPASEMAKTKVSTRVNKAGRDDPSLILPDESNNGQLTMFPD